jgi:hypothetical protein
MKRLSSIILSIISALIVSNCQAPPVSQVSKEEAFWKWFESNEARLFNFEKDQEKVFDELTTEMHNVQPDLSFEFGREKNGSREFVISANGMRAAFPAVESLADKAPALPRWKITKFRPREDGASTISMDGVDVSTDQVTFTIEPDGEKAGITLFFEVFDQKRQETYASLGFILLDHALGEYDVVTKVGFIEFKANSEPSKLKKLPFTELPSTFDRFVKASSN